MSVKLSENEKRMLRLCKETPRSSQEIKEALGHVSLSGSDRRSLSRLLEFGLLEMTIPGKPRSKNQRYRTTKNGRLVLEN